MKTTKKLLAVLLSALMLLAMAIPTFAQTVGNKADNTATITIRNAAKGETYAVYKLFSATVTGVENGSIAYTGTIPESLSAYFEADTVGNISVKEEISEEELFKALAAWADSESVTAVASAVSDGSTLEFNGLEYGYYVVTTSQGDAAITVTSTNPNATIYDKNSTTPVGGLKKEADDTDVNIGDTVTYTVKFNTANYSGDGASAKQIISYTIKDTLPDFLSDVTVTGITIGGKDYKVNNTVPQFDENGQIVISWAEGGTNLYANGAEIVITYTAVVSADAAIDGNGNKNAVSITYTDEDGTTSTDKYESDVTIYTYAIAIVKVNDDGGYLAGATFQLPFYVNSTPASDGSYVYAGTTAGEGLTNTVTTPDTGIITIKGVSSGTYSIEETAAPAGYNKLTESFTVTAVQTKAESTNKTFYLDEDGKVTDTVTETKVTYENDNFAAAVAPVVNKAGSTLPSTGGTGTTIFYVLGAILVLGAGVVLVSRRRMSAEK